MGPEAIAHRVAMVVFAAATAGLPATPYAQVPTKPKEPPPVLFPQEVPASAPQDPAKANANAPVDPGANPQGAASPPEQNRDAEQPAERATRIPSTARPAPMPWRIVPRLSIAETYSDNIARVPAGLAQPGWLTRLSPGVRAEGGGGRVRGLFDYQLNDFHYGNQPQLNSTQNQLNSQLSVEAVQDWLFLDARARILQLNRSAFGATTPEGTGANANLVETSVVQLSPYVRGAISDAALYQLRYNGTTSRTGSNAVPETKTAEWVGRVKNAPSASPVGWSVDGSTLTLNNASVGSKEHVRIRGSVMYALYPELHLSVYDGIESTDFTGPVTQRNSTPGFGVEWTPGARTQIAALTEKRFFGNGHSLLLSHRTPLVAFRITDDKDISVLPVQLASAGQSSVYGLLNDLLASSVPDPAARAAAVRTQLERTGTPDGSPAASTFLTSGATLVQRREASVTMLGRRNTVTLQWNQQQYHAIGGNLGLVANTNGTLNLSQQGLTASWAYKLSPRSSITLADAYLQTKDLNANGIASKLHSQTLQFLTQVGPKTSLSVGGRRARFDSSAVASYRENALLGMAAWHF